MPFTTNQAAVEVTVVKEPELRFTPQGHAVCTVYCVWSDRKRGADGSWSDGPGNFFEVVAWRGTAENLAESANVGDRLVVIGHWEVEQYEKRDGSKGVSPRLVAQSVGLGLTFHPARSERPPRGQQPERMEAKATTAPSDPWGGRDQDPPF